MRFGVGNFAEWTDNCGQRVARDPATMTALMVGTPAAAATATTAATAATAGLFGTAGTFSLATTLGTVGAGLGALGAIQAGKAESASAEYNAAMARHEAQSEEARRRRESQRQLGAIRAGRAKSGVTAEGTPLMVLSESAEMAELDALTARWSGESKRDLYKMQARSARKAIPYNVGASLLSSAGKLGMT